MNWLMHQVSRYIRYVYNQTHWFTDREAWTLFRLFAFGEALGWTLLISAIVYRAFDGPGYTIAISLAGKMHGVLFILYFLFVFLTARSMQWGPRRIIAALLAGIPPYTSLIFEQVMAYHRKRHPAYVAPPADI